MSRFSGAGLIHGKGLSRGDSDADLPMEAGAGVANKAIALKNCRNVILANFAISRPVTSASLRPAWTTSPSGMFASTPTATA